MIKTTAANRLIIKSYLSNLSEDELIEQVIIPLFNSSGYVVYRLITHGPGEHGKDIIFFRHVPLFYDHEFIVVQAKAEKVNAYNITHFAQQCLRAYKTGFASNSGGENKKANYVLFINSKEHTNDATAEFPEMVENNNNIKILSQQNLIELFILQDFIPHDLIGKLDVATYTGYEFEERIRRILAGGNDKEIEALMNTELRIETREMSPEIKGYIINYIFLVWTDNWTWSGTVNPMKWIDTYFEMIQPEQFSKLFNVFKEYTSLFPSREAKRYTQSVIEKIKPLHIASFEMDFLLLIAKLCIENSISKYQPLEKLFRVFANSNLSKNSNIAIISKIREYIHIKDQISLTGKGEPSMASLQDSIKETKKALRIFLYPED